MTLDRVREFVVPTEVVDQTLQPLQEAGNRGYEAFVLWGGHLVTAERFEFVSAYFPAQRTSRGKDGLLVVVEGDALFRVNRAFYERGLTLAGQVHSHPTDAYHSDTDDTYPLMTLIGGLSGVVPDFGRGGREHLSDWAWYRLVGAGQWVPVGDETSISFQ
ncbi:MAG: Mov34/MPN/PAD-1 family protein [Actinomycetota bacterium]|nr:Mov34/MPN/PAD-1 family protein [Actinomycetota bacterium]